MWKSAQLFVYFVLPDVFAWNSVLSGSTANKGCNHRCLNLETNKKEWPSHIVPQLVPKPQARENVRKVKANDWLQYALIPLDAAKCHTLDLKIKLEYKLKVTYCSLHYGSLFILHMNYPDLQILNNIEKNRKNIFVTHDLSNEFDQRKCALNRTRQSPTFHTPTDVCVA